MCEVCRGYAPPEYSRCYACHQALTTLGIEPPAVLPLGLAVKHRWLASALYRYKDGRERESEEARQLLQRFAREMDPHITQCLFAEWGHEPDVVVPVPSASGREEHPLPALLEDTVAAGRALSNALRVRRSTDARQHHAGSVQFSVVESVRGKNVLLVDDTWTTGANALTATSTLRAAGARSVAIVVLGRHFSADWELSRPYLDVAAPIGFDARWCAICDQRPTGEDAPFKPAKIRASRTVHPTSTVQKHPSPRTNQSTGTSPSRATPSLSEVSQGPEPVTADEQPLTSTVSTNAQPPTATRSDASRPSQESSGKPFRREELAPTGQSSLLGTKPSAGTPTKSERDVAAVIGTWIFLLFLFPGPLIGLVVFGLVIMIAGQR